MQCERRTAPECAWTAASLMPNGVGLMVPQMLAQQARYATVSAQELCGRPGMSLLCRGQIDVPAQTLTCFSPVLSPSLDTSRPGALQTFIYSLRKHCCLQAAESAEAALLGTLAADGAAACSATRPAMAGPAQLAAVAGCEQPRGALRSAAAEPRAAWERSLGSEASNPAPGSSRALQLAFCDLGLRNACNTVILAGGTVA